MKQSGLEFEYPSKNISFNPLELRYQPNKPIFEGLLFKKSDRKIHTKQAQTETEPDEFLQKLGSSMRLSKTSGENTSKLADRSQHSPPFLRVVSAKSNPGIRKTKKSLKKKVVKKKNMKAQSIKRTTDWKGLSQKLTEIEQDFEQKDKQLHRVRQPAVSHDFKNFSWTIYKSNDQSGFDHADEEEEKDLIQRKVRISTKNKVKFYKNSKFKSNDFNESYDKINDSRRERIMTFEKQNYSMLNPAPQMPKQTKIARESSIYGGDLITLRK